MCFGSKPKSDDDTLLQIYCIIMSIKPNQMNAAIDTMAKLLYICFSFATHYKTPISFSVSARMWVCESKMVYCVKYSKYKHLDSNLDAHFIHLPFGNFIDRFDAIPTYRLMVLMLLVASCAICQFCNCRFANTFHHMFFTRTKLDYELSRARWKESIFFNVYKNQKLSNKWAWSEKKGTWDEQMNTILV